MPRTGTSNSDGQPYALSGVSLDGTGANFDMGQVQGKVLVVYFWASWNNQTVGDFAKLKLIAESYKAKGMELVTVNCDQTAAEGLGVMKRTPIPGIHLHQPGGLDGKLCTEWGLMVLPHLVVVGKDGKVASGNAQLATLEEDVNKLTK
jgi:thiol-disulfide isomerase/thioredoxin